MGINQATQRKTTKEGPEQQVVPLLSAVPAARGGLFSTPVRVTDNGVLAVEMVIDFGAATEIIIVEQVSNNLGVTWYDRLRKSTIDANNRMEALPDILSLKKAKLADVLTGNLANVILPFLMTPDAHQVRLDIFADAPGATISVKTLGGRGL